MASKVLSVEVGYSFTKVCEMDYQSKKPKIYNCFVLPTPDGILADGMLTADDGFVLSFKEQLSKNKIKTKAAVFTISSSKIASREVRIPYCKENRIGDLVRSNLQDYFPIDVSQYKVAYSILETEGAAADEFEDEKKKQPTGYKLLLLAVPFQILEGYRSFASAVGLDVKEIDYNGNSVYQAAKEACAEGTQMVVKIDERSSLILVMKDGVIELNRTIPYGIDNMVSALMETSSWGNFASYKWALDLSMKKTCVLSRFYNPDMIERPTAGAVDTEAGSDQVTPLKKDKITVTNTLISLVGGISKVVDYYNANHGDAPIEKMYVTGVGADILGITKLLSNEIGFKINKLQNVTGIFHRTV